MITEFVIIVGKWKERCHVCMYVVSMDTKHIWLNCRTLPRNFLSVCGGHLIISMWSTSKKLLMYCRGHIVKWSFSSTKKRGRLCFVFQKWLASFLPLWYTHTHALFKYPSSSFLKEFLCLLFTLAPIMSLPLLKSRHEISPPPMPQEILENGQDKATSLRDVYCLSYALRFVCMFRFIIVFALCDMMGL